MAPLHAAQAVRAQGDAHDVVLNLPLEAGVQLEVHRLSHDLESLRTVISQAVTRILYVKTKHYSHFDQVALANVGQAVAHEQEQIKLQLEACMRSHAVADVQKVADRAFSDTVNEFPAADVPFFALYNQLIWSVLEKKATDILSAPHTKPTLALVA